MQTDHPAAEADRQSIIPEDAGLDAGRHTSLDDGPRDGHDLLNAVADGEAISPTEHDNLVDYWLSNGELPGDSRPTRLTVKLGHGDAAKPFQCAVTSITWDEWQDARERATNEKEQKFDTFVLASWCVARALREPQLGPVVQRLQRAAGDDGMIDGRKAPDNAAVLLRQMFAHQPGLLLEIHGKVLELSGLQDGAGAVTEVDAAKN